MSIAQPGLWQGLALLQHELLLFAGVFFLVGALDDLAVDMAWVWLKLRGRAVTARRNRAALQQRTLAGPVAALIPAWREAAVIGHTIRHLLDTWPQATLRLYVGCYRNDPATIRAVIDAARGDNRLRLVVHGREGPTTKADCLNRLFAAITLDEERSAQRFAMLVFHDAEDMVDPAALGLLDETIAGGADFAALAKSKSMDPGSAAQGGDLGCFEPGQMVESFDRASFTGPLNQAQVVQSEFGWHVLRVNKRSEGGLLPLAEATPLIREELSSAAAQKYVDAQIAKVKVESFPELVQVTPAQK